jgi:hypothetical protein
LKIIFCYGPERPKKVCSPYPRDSVAVILLSDYMWKRRVHLERAVQWVIVASMRLGIHPHVNAKNEKEIRR